MSPGWVFLPRRPAAGAPRICGEFSACDRRGLNSQSFDLYQKLASGFTAPLVLHGSANAIGGQSVVITHKWKRPVRGAGKVAGLLAKKQIPVIYRLSNMATVEPDPP